jgi:LysM repeat protein
MNSEKVRRALPWALLAAILAVGITAVVEVGTSGGGDDKTAASVVGPPASSAAVSPSSPAPSVTRSPSPTKAVARSSSAPTVAATKLPQLSDTHPSYPPTQTLVDKKDGLIVAVYTVQRGDYLSQIANRFQTALTDVYVWSKDTVGANADLIYSGQQIVVKVLGKL